MNEEPPSALLSNLHITTNSSADEETGASVLEEGGAGVFKYQPLNESEDCIRLLAIEPEFKDGTRYTTVFCTLKHVSFRQKPKYEALSYRWGVSDATELITLDSQDFRVRKNLYDALYHLRREHGERLLWIDAVCIDQSNLEERKRQVRLMDFIYTRASCVLVWLGIMPIKNDSECYTDLAPEVDQSLPGGARWVSSDQYRSWVSENEYWDRVWIIQEIGLARRLRVCTNTWSLSWNEFFSALSLMKSTIQNFQVIRKLDEKRRDRHGPSNLLKNLLEDFQYAQCQDPRDKIFGFLGLAHDCEDGTIEVDYSKSLFDLYLAVMQFFCRPRVLDSRKTLFYNPTETVHLSDLVQRLLNPPCMPANVMPPPNFFFAMGAYGGHILKLGPTALDLYSSSAAYKEWRRGLGEHYSLPEDIRKLREANEAYDDLLLREGDLICSKVRSINPNECLSGGLHMKTAFKFMKQPSAIGTMSVTERNGVLSCRKELSSLKVGVKAAISDQHDVTGIPSKPAHALSNPRIMLATNLLLGLAPPDAMEGDLICLFEGTEVVAIIRKHPAMELLQVVGRVHLSTGLLKEGSLVYGKRVEPAEFAMALTMYMDVKTLVQLTSEV